MSADYHFSIDPGGGLSARAERLTGKATGYAPQ